MSSPAEIICQLLLDLTLANDTGDWTVYVSFFPDDPDSAICVYDMVGKKDGRLMKTGEQIEHPGIQIMVRSASYPEGWKKAEGIALALDTQRKSVVAADSENSYIVHNVSRTGNILHAGQEMEGDRRRHLFVVNALVTIEATD